MITDKEKTYIETCLSIIKNKTCVSKSPIEVVNCGIACPMYLNGPNVALTCIIQSYENAKLYLAKYTEEEIFEVFL